MLEAVCLMSPCGMIEESPEGQFSLTNEASNLA
nr:MAG TPA: hypothetical protein [Caudoviricetes sp.]